MKKLLVISNHPFSQRVETQWDEIKFIPYPAISPCRATDEELKEVDEICDEILTKRSQYTVRIQGEFTIPVMLVSRLSKMGFDVFFLPTENIVEENGVKKSVFDFVLQQN